MDYAGLDAMAVRAFMDGVMSGLYNIGFMYGSNTMLMAGGGGSGGVQNVGGREWLPKYTDNMNMCNVFRAALSDVPGDIVGIKGFTIAPDNSIYVTYSYVRGSSRPPEDGEDGGTERVILEYGFSERTTKFSLPPRGDLQKMQSNGGRSGWDNANIVMSSTMVGIGLQGEMMDYAVRTSFKSANSWYAYNQLRGTQKAWRQMAILGKDGALLRNGMNVLGKGVFLVQAGVSGYSAISALASDDANKWGVTGKAALDIAVGAISVWGGPVGWVVGGVYFIGG